MSTELERARVVSAEAEGEMPTQWQRIENHTRTLDRAVRMTQMADGKVAPILALHASLAAVTVSQADSIGGVLTGDSAGLTRALVAWALLLAYAAFSLLSFRQVALIYIPTAPTRGRRPTHGHSLFYFDDIQAMPLSEYAERSIRPTSMDGWEEDVLLQTHIVSGVASRKLAGVQQAYLLSGLTLAAWLPLIVDVRL